MIMCSVKVGRGTKTIGGILITARCQYTRAVHEDTQDWRAVIALKTKLHAEGKVDVREPCGPRKITCC